MAKGLKASEVREWADVDIRSRVVELEEERFRLGFRAATETLEDSLRLRLLRRDIARLKTVLRERERGAAVTAAGGDRRMTDMTHGAPTSAAARAVNAAPAGTGGGSGSMAPQTERNGASLARRSRKTRVGKVVSDQMQKTVVVAIERRVPHPVYGKMVTRTTRLKAHDEQNASKAGDTVRIMETRPLSKDKRWRVIEILDRAR